MLLLTILRRTLWYKEEKKPPREVKEQRDVKKLQAVVRKNYD